MLTINSLTWKTLGALTNEAKAEDRVAEKIPALIRGPNADTKLITCETVRIYDTFVGAMSRPWL